MGKDSYLSPLSIVFFFYFVWETTFYIVTGSQKITSLNLAKVISSLIIRGFDLEGIPEIQNN